EERPGEIRIAVLDIVFAFFPLVADSLAIHAPTVGGEVPDVHKAAQISSLEHNRPGNHRSNARYGEQHLVLRSGLKILEDRALNNFQLRREHFDRGAMSSDAELNVRIRQFRPGLLAYTQDDFARQPNGCVSPQCALGG